MELQDLRLLGGRLCLDFANSYDFTRAGERVDFLQSYDNLVCWGRHAGVLTDDDLTRLTAAAEVQPDTALSVFEDAAELRDVLRRVFRAIASEMDVASPDIARLQRAAGQAIASGKMTPAGDRFVWDWRADASHLDQILWPIAHSAIELLAEGELQRVKVCASHGCGWLFYDGSKNGSRRWCSMEGCGSQDKMRRQYAKRRARAHS